MKKQIHIGCSSFNNILWKKIFYPEELARPNWFDYYCTVFDTYELNSTFYKFPTLKTLQNWYKKAPEHFMFSVKAPKQITHIQKFNNCAELINEFYSVCQDGLKEKLGCILFQLPPSYHYSEEKLLSIIEHLNPEFSNVIEFRHESWWIPEVQQKLSEKNITFCSVSHPLLPETNFTGEPVVYKRLHGNTRMFYSNYSDEYLSNLSETILNTEKEKPVYIYFNNTASTAGILNAVQLKKVVLSK